MACYIILCKLLSAIFCKERISPRFQARKATFVLYSGIRFNVTLMYSNLISHISTFIYGSKILSISCMLQTVRQILECYQVQTFHRPNRGDIHQLTRNLLVVHDYFFNNCSIRWSDYPGIREQSCNRQRMTRLFN